MNQKRNSIDAAAAARRASFHDQKPAAGMFGSMWAKYVCSLCALSGWFERRVLTFSHRFTTGHEGK